MRDFGQFGPERERLPAVHGNINRGGVGGAAALLFDVELELAQLAPEALFARDHLARHALKNAREVAQ